MNDTSAPPPGRPKAGRIKKTEPRSGEPKSPPREGRTGGAGLPPPPGRPKAGRIKNTEPRSGEPKSPPREGRTGGAGLQNGLRVIKSEAPVQPAAVFASGERVSKLMAERGLCSRREADAYIERGLVFVDGERVTQLGTRAPASAVITLANEARAQQARQMTLLLHKPIGYVSGQAEDGYKPAVVLVSASTQHVEDKGPRFSPAHLRGLAPAGRLDIDSTGLLVLTQDGRIARQLIGDNSDIEKEYLVRVEGKLDARGLALLNHGLSLDDRQLRPARVEWANEDQLRFILKEGRKRQIRRMCELVGLRVTGLKRVRIGRVRLGDLPLGQWRYLRPDEKF